MKKTFKLDDITAYKIASELSDNIWKIVIQWPFIAQRTIGIQIINAVDSIAANIAEGFGRFHKKDKVKFYYNSRASVFESAHWSKKAYKRRLVTKGEYERIIKELRKLPKEINTLIKITMKNLEK